MDKLKSKWYKAKQKAIKAVARELELRSLIDEQLAAAGKEKEITTFPGGKTVTFTRSLRQTVPKAAIPDLVNKLDKEVFDLVFNVSHTLKPAIYNNLTGEAKKVLDSKVVSKYGALKVSITNE